MKTHKLRILIAVIVAITTVLTIALVIWISVTKGKKGDLGEAFTYNLNEFRRTDPALVKYEEIDRIDTGFQNPFAIALKSIDSSDRIYVSGDRSIRVFRDSGHLLLEISVTGIPRCLAIADDGDIYVGMRDHIEVYGPDGAYKASWDKLGPNAVLTSVAVSENDIFVADAGNRVVLRYSRSGKLLNRIGERDEAKNIPGLVVPTPYLDVAIAPDGLLRVANPGLLQIEAYTFDGYMEFSWGEASMAIQGFSGCSNPANFAILPDGRFVTCEKGLPRVKIYKPDGTFESIVAGAELFPKSEEYLIPDTEPEDKTGALDVAYDSQNRILVLDPMEKAVRIFSLLVH